MSQRTPILSIRDAEKSYGRVAALRGVTLDLYPGELLGFLGPNGAGKTTLIRCLAGRSKLDRGSLHYAQGASRHDLPGVVPQTIAVYEDLTAEQNLVAFGKLHAVPRDQLHDRVREALRWSNLADRRRHLVKTFSGGMKRRLNIACSVLHEPRILLLDEPTVGVDPQSRQRIYDMLNELRERGTAILLATHQLEEAQAQCDRIAIVDQGRVVRIGTFDELVACTVGRHQRLTVQFQKTLAAPPGPLTLDASGTVGTCEIDNIGSELPRVIQAIESTTEPIDNIVLHRPTLQDVFLHLTGRELRE